MYDSDISTITTALTNSNPTIFSPQTINDILALTTRGADTKVNVTQTTPDANGNVTVGSGAELVYIGSSDTVQTTIKPPVNAPVVIFQGKGGVIATINDGLTLPPTASQTTPDRVVVGTAGSDRIIVADAKNTKIILGSGNDSVQTGGGVDTVEAGLGNSSIVGGSGDYAVVKLKGNASNYTVTSQNGHAVVTDKTTKLTTDISKIQYVQLDNGNALVFAKNSVEASVAALYRVAFGRDADAGGLDYWFDLARAGTNLKQIAGSFVASTEFNTVHAGQNNAAFVQSLYQSTFGRAGEEAGVNYWTDALANGSTRADLVTNFATLVGQNIAGTINTEAQIVGSVMIVTGII